MPRTTLSPHRISGALLFALTLFVGMLHVSPAAALCPATPGDLDADGDTNVVDVQCAILTALNLLSDEEFPACLAVAPEEADINCDAAWDITDVVLSINIALQMWPKDLDGDGNGCIDACEKPLCTCLLPDCSEVFDGEDNNCNDEVDEGFEQEPYKVFALDGIHTEVLSSTDNGDTWQFETDMPAPAPASVSITSSGADAIFVVTSGSDNPTYRSLDAGQSFEPAGIWKDKSYNAAICAHPTLGIVYGTDASGNIHRSFDNAETFEWVGSWPTEGSSLACVVTPSGTLYLIDAAYMGGPVHASLDSGNSVIKKSNYGGKSGNMAAIASDPAGNLFALDGENNVMLSTDEAETWSQLGSIPAGNQTVQTLATGGLGVLYAATPNPSNTGTGGRFFVSTDMGWTWSETSNWKGPDGPTGWVGLTTLPLP